MSIGLLRQGPRGLMLARVLLLAFATEPAVFFATVAGTWAFEFAPSLSWEPFNG